MVDKADVQSGVGGWLVRQAEKLFPSDNAHLTVAQQNAAMDKAVNQSNDTSKHVTGAAMEQVKTNVNTVAKLSTPSQ